MNPLSLADDMNFPVFQFVLTLISLDLLGFQVSMSGIVTSRTRLEHSPSSNGKQFLRGLQEENFGEALSICDE